MRYAVALLLLSGCLVPQGNRSPPPSLGDTIIQAGEAGQKAAGTRTRCTTTKYGQQSTTDCVSR